MNTKYFFSIIILIFSVNGFALSTDSVNMNSFSINLVNYTNINADKDFKIDLYIDCFFGLWRKSCGEKKQIRFSTSVTPNGLRLVTENKIYQYLKGKKKKVRVNFCIDHQGASSDPSSRCTSFNLSRYENALSGLYYFAPKSFPTVISPTINNVDLARWVRLNPSKRFSVGTILVDNNGKKNNRSYYRAYTALDDNSQDGKLTLYPYSRSYFFLSTDFIQNNKVTINLKASILEYRKNSNGIWRLTRRKNVLNRKYRVDLDFLKVPSSITNLEVK